MDNNNTQAIIYNYLKVFNSTNTNWLIQAVKRAIYGDRFVYYSENIIKQIISIFGTELNKNPPCVKLTKLMDLKNSTSPNVIELYNRFINKASELSPISKKWRESIESKEINNNNTMSDNMYIPLDLKYVELTPLVMRETRGHAGNRQSYNRNLFENKNVIGKSNLNRESFYLTIYGEQLYKFGGEDILIMNKEI